jgi:hypothetical protein
MSRQTAFIALALVASVSALVLSIVDSVSVRQRLAALEAQTQAQPQPLPAEDKQQIEMAAEFTKTITGLRESIAKANAAKRTPIRPVPQNKGNPE